MIRQVALLIDVENCPPEMAVYAVRLAQKDEQTITAVSDWTACKEDKRKLWVQFRTRKDISIIQIDRATQWKNALDYALIQAARQLYTDGYRQFYFLTSDNDFIEIVNELTAAGARVMGVGQVHTTKNLRTSYTEFLYFPPELGRKLASKEAWANKIPVGMPTDAVRFNLVEAYRLIAKNYQWVRLDKFSSIWKSFSRELEIPEDHPKKFKNMIKIYHDSFEWKHTAGILFIRLKNNNN